MARDIYQYLRKEAADNFNGYGDVAKEAAHEIERLRAALREIDAGIYNDNGTVTTIGDLAIRKIAQTALQPKE